jgi:hypothetical protein
LPAGACALKRYSARIILLILPASPFATVVAVRSWRLRFGDFFVRMWLLYAFSLLIFPVPVTLNLLAEARLDFIFGILYLLLN